MPLTACLIPVGSAGRKVIMTINTTFVSGNVLTATQQNNFPRGLAATPATSTTTDSTITVEEVMLTYTFTAVSGRNYLLQYFEPVIVGTAGGTLTARIRATDIVGTVLNTFKSTIATATNTTAFVQVIYTAASSASLTIVSTLQASAEYCHGNSISDTVPATVCT